MMIRPTYIGESLQDLRHDSHKRSNHHQLNHNTNAVRNGVTDNRDNYICKGGDDRHSKTHHDGRLQLRGDSQGRADTEYLAENGMVEVQRIGENLFILFTE